MKTSVSSYSYHKLLNKGEMDLFQVMDKTKEFGFDAIEFVEFTAPEGKTMGHAGAIVSGSAGTAQAKKEALEAAGVKVGKTPSETAQLAKDLLDAM